MSPSWALQGQRAYKGILIATTDVSRDASDYAATLQNTIILVNGRQLAELMLDYGVGVSDGETLNLTKLEEDYCGEEWRESPSGLSHPIQS